MAEKGDLDAEMTHRIGPTIRMGKIGECIGDLKVKEVHFPNQDFNECLFVIVGLQLAGRDSLLVGVLYRSPSCNEENNRQLNRLMVEIRQHTASHKLLMGDFNYREIN